MASHLAEQIAALPDERVLTPEEEALLSPLKGYFERFHASPVAELPHAARATDIADLSD